MTKWGFRYLLKISLKSNPACYTIETTFGPFNVAFRNASYPPFDDHGNRSSDFHFVWTSKKCHPVRIDLQASVVLNRSSQQVIPGSVHRDKTNQISIPTSRFIDYLCDLNVEKLSIFLINFLSNRAANTALELLPTQLRTKQTTGHKSGQKQFLVTRDFAFLHEANYPLLVRDFIVNNRLSINGTQCLQMNFRSKDVTMLSYANYFENGTRDGDEIRDIFNQHYQIFANYQKQTLRQRLINMTFIYSSELFLKIKQVYLDDKPLYVAPKPPSPPGDKQKKKNDHNTERNFDKRKIVPKEDGEPVLNSTKAFNITSFVVEPIDDLNVSVKEKRPKKIATTTTTTTTTTSRPFLTLPPTSWKPDVEVRKQSTKVILSTRKPKLLNDTVLFVSNSKTFFTGRPLIWILVLFANTALVFGFIILLSFCYYRSKSRMIY